MRVGFLHIPRTGGTYLEAIIQQQLDESQFVNFFGTPENQICNRVGIIENISPGNEVCDRLEQNSNWNTCKVFSGHFSLYIEECIDTKETSYITIVREPIQRVVSFVKKVTTKKSFRDLLMVGAHEVGDDVFWRNFKNYVEGGYSRDLMLHELHGFSNYMTKVFAGLDISSNDIIVNDSVLEIAKKRVDDMLYVGVFEEYEASISNILNILNINQPFVYKPLHYSSIPDSIKGFLCELNYYDIELYNYILNK